MHRPVATSLSSQISPAILRASNSRVLGLLFLSTDKLRDCAHGRSGERSCARLRPEQTRSAGVVAGRHRGAPAYCQPQPWRRCPPCRSKRRSSSRCALRALRADPRNGTAFTGTYPGRSSTRHRVMISPATRPEIAGHGRPRRWRARAAWPATAPGAAGRRRLRDPRPSALPSCHAAWPASSIAVAADQQRVRAALPGTRDRPVTRPAQAGRGSFPSRRAGAAHRGGHHQPATGPATARPRRLRRRPAGG